ncbi:MAG: leucine-rich repeat domain-containing protein [Promethearchaeota archaeon]
MSVIYRNKEFTPKIKVDLLNLDLSGKRIKNISEIKNIEMLTELQVLNLSNNQINEIEGLII